LCPGVLFRLTEYPLWVGLAQPPPQAAERSARPRRHALHLAFRHLLVLNQEIENIGLLDFNPVLVGHADTWSAMLSKRWRRARCDARGPASGNSIVARSPVCRVHEALRITPAMAQRLTDHVWTVGELLTACLENAPTKPRKAHRRFTVIQGGKP
jgi:hypothetical protein